MQRIISSAVLTVVAAGALTACASSAKSPGPVGTSTPAGTSSPAGIPAGPATENAPPGDIPDNQAFVPYSHASPGFTVKIPEGWAMTTADNAVVFTDKYNNIRIASIAAATAPTVSSARAAEVPAIQSGVTGFRACQRVLGIARRGNRSAHHISSRLGTEPGHRQGGRGGRRTIRVLAERTRRSRSAFRRRSVRTTSTRGERSPTRSRGRHDRVVRSSDRGTIAVPVLPRGRRGNPCATRGFAADRGRRIRRGGRAVRFGQVHAARVPGRNRRARRRHRSRRRATPEPPAGAGAGQDARAAHRTGVPIRQPARSPDARAERPAGATPRPRRSTLRSLRSCSASLGIASRVAMPTHINCPAANSRAPALPSPWRTTRSCCSPTNRPASSTSAPNATFCRHFCSVRWPGAAVLVASHSPAVAAAADRVITLADGRVAA